MDIYKQLYLISALHHIKDLIKYARLLDGDIIDGSYLEEIESKIKQALEFKE